MDQNRENPQKKSGIGWLGQFGERRNYVIDRRLQSRLVGYTFRHILIVVAAVAFVLFAPSLNILLEDNPQSKEAVASATKLLQLHSRFWTTAILVILLVATDSLRLSHRIAGPLHRFRVALQQWRSGEIPQKIQLRDGDLLHEFCDEVNVALDEARQEREAQNRRTQELEQLVSEAQGVCRDSGGEVAVVKIQEILHRMDQLVCADPYHSRSTPDASGGAPVHEDLEGETRRAA